MSRDINGNYSLPPVVNPVVSNTAITVAWANPTMNDIASALTDSLSRSGAGSMSAALKIIDGTVGAPGISFAGESTTGLYRISSGNLGVSVTGTLLGTWNSTGLVMNGTTSVTAGTISVTSTLLFNSVGGRISGDFTAGTVADRPIFQTNVGNSSTTVGAMPSGTGTTAGFTAYNSSTPGASGTLAIQATATTAQILASRTGAGAFPTLALYTSDSERLRIETTGLMTINGPGISPVAGAILGVFGGAVQISPGTSAQPGLRIQQAGGASVTMTAINNDNNTFSNMDFVTSGTSALTIRTDNSLWTNANTQPAFLTRAWCNFNGTLASPISPRASGNVSSVTKHATGEYTVNFLTNLVDANYAVTVGVSANPSFTAIIATHIFTNRTTNSVVAPTASGFRFCTTNASTNAALDVEYVCIDVKR